ncbi:MAG TPA: hypothetical protein VIK72_08320 [Clostridiaceae bacterium]
MQQENIFEKIIDNMVKDGYLKEDEATNLKVKHFNYVNNLKQINRIIPIKVEDKVEVISEQRKLISTVKEPAQFTKEQIRERNLSWILNIGVILLLISGLIFATSTWGSFNNVIKVSLLFCVSLFFFIISIFSKNVLKIIKSSNAFWIMGSLFLPLSLLSIGFFRLIGSYFSIFGEGRFVYGVFCTLICLPVFIFSTYKFKSRIFSWLSLSIISLLFGFMVASLYLPHLVLVFILFAFNGLILFVKQKVSRNSNLEIFFKELSVFIQFNLLLTLILTMTTYSRDILYSINLLMVALIVFALGISEKQEVYDYLSAFIFSVGICLLGSNINNYSLQLSLITSIGIVFSTIAFAYNKEAKKYQRYSVLSVIATALSFFYIAIICIPSMGTKDPIIYIGAACLVLLILNYIWLYLKNNLAVVGFLIPLQTLVVIYEGLYIINFWTVFNNKLEYLILMTLLLFTFGYAKNNIKHINEFKVSCAIGSLISTFIIFIWCSIQKGAFISLPIIAATFTLQIFILWLKNNNKDMKLIMGYVLPFVTFGGLCLIRFSYNLNYIPKYPFYFGCALIVFCVHYAIAFKLPNLKASFFYLGHILLFIEFSALLIVSESLVIQTLSIFVMFGIYLYSIYYLRKNVLAFLWLNALLITFTIFLFDLALMINTYGKLDLKKYVLYANGFLLILLYRYIRKSGFKRNLVIYLSLLTVILLCGNIFAINILWYEYLIELIFAALLCLVITKTKLERLLFIPLLLYITTTHILIYYVLKSSLFSVPVILAGAVILLTVSRLKNRLLFSKGYIDFYSITALFSIFLLPYHYNTISIEGFGIIIPGIFGSLWFFAIRKRMLESDDRLGNILFAVSLLWPFYALISSLNLPNSFIYEVCFLPLVVLTYVCVKWIYKEEHLHAIEYTIPIFCYVVLTVHLMLTNSIIEAVIVIAFGLLSLMYGSILKTKSALFMGGILIVLIVIIKSRDFWLSVQWWIYLAVLGGSLVITASINEYKKNKNSKGILSKFNMLLEKFSDWN